MVVLSMLNDNTDMDQMGRPDETLAETRVHPKLRSKIQFGCSIQNNLIARLNLGVAQKSHSYLYKTLLRAI